MNASNPTSNELVSYLTLRRIVGLLGMLLPIILALVGFRLIGWGHIQPSISDYYSLRTRDLFVGILFTIGWFLFTYRGFDRQDEIAGNLACVFALGVALFPNSGTAVESTIHFSSATALFLVLAYFSLALFTKTGGKPTPRKLVRNTIYRTCGVAMLLCIALIGLCHWTPLGAAVDAYHPVFWLESMALWAFGVSWFVKGETLCKDRLPAPRSTRTPPTM